MSENDSPEAQDEPILEVRDLTHGYSPQTTTFEHVNLTVEPGDVITILGRNGAGKTTLLNCIGGLLRPRSGSVLLQGTPLTKLSQEQIALKLGYVAQLQSLAFDFTVRDFLVMGRAPHISRLKTPGASDYRVVERVLRELDIVKLADKGMGELSGGERQQVCIARVLVQEPRIILLDEPTNHLDYGNQIKVLELIATISQDEGIAVILTSHAPDFALLLGGKTAILDAEGHLTVGPSEEIVTEERLRDMYGTDLHLEWVEGAGRMACVAGSLRRRV
jgi:iron complex transport system ATP-binding protein